MMENLDELEQITEGSQSKAIECNIAKDNIKYYREALFKINKGLKQCKKLSNPSERFHCNNELMDLVTKIDSEIDHQMDIVSNTCIGHRILRSLGRGLAKLGKIVSKSLDDAIKYNA
jgi:hypothetical protein